MVPLRLKYKGSSKSQYTPFLYSPSHTRGLSRKINETHFLSTNPAEAICHLGQGRWIAICRRGLAALRMYKWVLFWDKREETQFRAVPATPIPWIPGTACSQRMKICLHSIWRRGKSGKGQGLVIWPATLNRQLNSHPWIMQPGEWNMKKHFFELFKSSQLELVQKAYGNILINWLFLCTDTCVCKI